MEGRSNNQLNRTDNRRARAELTSRVEGLAQEILDHIASTPQPSTGAGRGRAPSGPVLDPVIGLCLSHPFVVAQVSVARVVLELNTLQTTVS